MKLAETLDNKAELTPILHLLADEAIDIITRGGGELGFAKFYVQALHILVDKHCDLVFSEVTSPIERIWMNSLQVQFLRDAAMLVTTPPNPDVQTWRCEMLSAIAHAREVLDRVVKSGYSPGAINIYLDDQVASGRLPLEERDCHYFWLMEYGILPFKSAHHLTLQAGFPKTGTRSRRMRVDALLWHPGDPALNLIVECDGYAYHANKQSFIHDRQRDRLLAGEGHTVMRFSGTEIMADPSFAVRDLYPLLRTCRIIHGTRLNPPGRDLWTSIHAAP